jgi:thioredoxin 1
VLELENPNQESNVAETIQQEQFEQAVLMSEKPVLVDFSASWCAPCRALAPIIDQLAIDVGSRARVVKLDVDAAPEIATRYRVQSIPCVIIFSKGEEVSRLVGVASKGKLSALLEASM